MLLNTVMKIVLFFITITEDKQCIKIAIKDSGPGISIEDLPHIFKPFYRANNTRTYYGNGLGLSIAQILAQKKITVIFSLKIIKKKVLVLL